MLYAIGVIVFAVGLLLSIALHEIGHLVPAKAFGVKAMPSSFLLRADRSVLWGHRGFRNEDREDLERRIAAALG